MEIGVEEVGGVWVDGHGQPLDVQQAVANRAEQRQQAGNASKHRRLAVFNSIVWPSL